jgi:hypothetical protein
MGVKVSSGSGPHTIRNKTLVTFQLQVRGVTLDPKHVGAHAVPRHAHIQIYLDRIPPDATRHADMKGIVAVTAAIAFSIGFTRSWLHLHTGRHRFLIALARNDDILYNVSPAAFDVLVR